jgi:hypothetical protein
MHVGAISLVSSASFMLTCLLLGIVQTQYSASSIVLPWPEFLQENWQCVVCLELALINVNGDYCRAGCLFADPVLSMLLCGDERLHTMLLDYYTSRELGKNADVMLLCRAQHQAC